MLIETTLHVHKSILERLDTGADVIGRSRTSIIKHLFQRIMKDNHRMIKTYSRIQYQGRDVRENWSRINIVFNEYEYEYCQDLRKFFKLSISLILAYAVLRYLDDLMKSNISTDKYFYRNYLFIRKIMDNVICWQLYWGIPPKFTDI
jgi:hypothetical protein